MLSWSDIVMIRSVFIVQPSFYKILKIHAGIDDPEKEPRCTQISNTHGNFVCNSLANTLIIKLDLDINNTFSGYRLRICEIKAWTEANIANFNKGTYEIQGTPLWLPYLLARFESYRMGSIYCTRAILDPVQQTDFYVDFGTSYPFVSLFLATTTFPDHRSESAALIVSVGDSTDYSLNTKCHATSTISLVDNIMETLHCAGATGRYITISRDRASLDYDFVLCHITALTNLCPATVSIPPLINQALVFDEAFFYTPANAAFIPGIQDSQSWDSPRLIYTAQDIECFRAQFWDLIDLDLVPNSSTTLVNTFEIGVHLISWTRADVKKTPYRL